jgi:hypothetical protein
MFCLAIGFTATPAMERLGWDLTGAQAPEDVAQEGMDNIANGPIWIVGGQKNVELVVERSKVADRAKLLKTFATPPRRMKSP